MHWRQMATGFRPAARTRSLHAAAERRDRRSDAGQTVVKRWSDSSNAVVKARATLVERWSHAGIKRRPSALPPRVLVKTLVKKLAKTHLLITCPKTLSAATRPLSTWQMLVKYWPNTGQGLVPRPQALDVK